MDLHQNSDLRFELSFVRDLCRVVDTPRSLTVYLLICGGPDGPTSHEFAQLCSLQCDPKHYDFAGDFADDYLVTSVLKKSSNIPLGVDTEQVAYASWLECHEHNRQTNSRFDDTDYVSLPEWWARYTDYLRRILGPLDARVLNSIPEKGKHGPGSIANARGGLTYVPSHKFDDRLSLPLKLLPFAESIMGDAWWELKSLASVACVLDWDEYFTVLKNAQTDRSCAKPPLLAVYTQLGIGSHLRDRLRLFGVDLRDQGFNQFLASKAQEWGLCTTDLRNASDLMALVPTRRALPARWWHLIELTRTEFTLIPRRLSPNWSVGKDGKRRRVPALVKQHKVCSMGNGYTFPLQTAIFLSVVRAIVPASEHGLTTAYGDDLIYPARYAKEVHAALEFLGFQVNHAKSCLAGRFFESCGTDWFDGQNVRPFFLRRERDDDDLDGGHDCSSSPIPYVLQVANMLRAWSVRRAAIDGRVGCDARFRPLWESLARSVPHPWNLPIPQSLGDAGVHTSFSEACAGDVLPAAKLRTFSGPSPKWPGKLGADGRVLRTDGWEGYAARHIVLSPVRVDRRTPGVLLSALHSLERRHGTGVGRRLSAAFYAAFPEPGETQEPSRGEEAVRGLFGRPRLGWALLTEWPEEAFGWVSTSV